MTLEEKVDEILMTLRGLETRIGFIEEDLETIKEGIVAINDTTVTIALNANSKDSGNANKASRLDEFQKASARW